MSLLNPNYFVIEQRPFRLSLNFARNENFDRLRPTYESLCSTLRQLQRKSPQEPIKIRLEKDVNERVRAYDEYAVRVYANETFIGSVDYPNSVVANFFIDLAAEGWVTLEYQLDIQELTENTSEGFEVFLLIRLITQSSEVFESLKIFNSPESTD